MSNNSTKIPDLADILISSMGKYKDGTKITLPSIMEDVMKNLPKYQEEFWEKMLESYEINNLPLNFVYLESQYLIARLQQDYYSEEDYNNKLKIN